MIDTLSSLAAISDHHGGFVIENTQVRVRMATAGVCHTDHPSLGWDGPLILGHEGAGWIDEGQLDVASMVTRRYTLQPLHEAMADMLAGSNVQGVIVFDQETA
jgi:Zn-dependent alcohol dehydrogenase